MIWAVLIPALIRPDLAVILAGVAALSVGLALTPRQPLARTGALIALVLSARLSHPPCSPRSSPWNITGRAKEHYSSRWRRSARAARDFWNKMLLIAAYARPQYYSICGLALYPERRAKTLPGRANSQTGA